MRSADRKVVDRLASILRVADALDVSHASVVTSVSCAVGKGKVKMTLTAAVRPDRELEKAEVKKDLFEKTFNTTLTFECN